ncbi:class I SAM-dependent methyltransferase [Pseudoscardovia suis]|uniref:class I SAM-dependent methyltransferase n=1 Tax=Pseudoscardovia suis TaxID=987063 RepID=UPI003F974AE7
MANPQVADQSPTDRTQTDRPQAQQAPAGRATQYFAGAPTTEDVRRTITVALRGRGVPMDVSNGVFSTDRLDLGTRVLLKHAPQPPAHGTFLDLGCGWGPIAVALALESPHADVWAVDVNERALDLTRSNAERNGCANVRVSAADAVPQDVRFDLMWSNPPIRIGKEALHELLMQWLVRLTVGGRAYLVVQRNLGADSLIPWLQQALDSQCGEQSFAVSKNASSKGYRVIEIVRAR